MTDAASLRARHRGPGCRRAPRRASRREARGVRARDGARDARPRRRGGGRGRTTVRAHVRARNGSSRRRISCPYYHAKWDDGAGRAGLRARARDLPAELHLRPRRRCAAAVQRGSRSAHPSRRSSGQGRSGSSPSGSTTSQLTSPPGVEKPEASGRTFELGGPDTVTWNEFWSRLKTALGVRRPAVHVPFGLMRAQAAVLEKLPKPPVTRDQLKMLAAGDNAVSNSGRRRHLRPLTRPPGRATAPRNGVNASLRVVGHWTKRAREVERAPNPTHAASGLRAKRESAPADSASCANKTDEGPLSRPFGLRY